MLEHADEVKGKMGENLRAHKDDALLSRAIDTLDNKNGDNVQMFSDLKQALNAPLKGMGTAFSSSLLGLAGSLVLGFLELQASQAHNRFYNELEDWLSGITELTPAGAGSSSSDYVNRQLLGAVVDMQRALEDFTSRLGEQPIAPPAMLGNAPAHNDDVRDLARGVNQLVNQMRVEQKVVREWVDEQAAQQSEVAGMLKTLADNMKRGG